MSMFTGVVIITLTFFWLMGLKRLATFLHLAKLSLFVVQMQTLPKSSSTLALYWDFAKYRALRLRKNPGALLGLFITVPAYVFIGISSLFTDKYFTLDPATAEELTKLLSTMAEEMDVPDMDVKTALKVQVIFASLVTLSYKYEFSNESLSYNRELASFMKEKGLDIAQLTKPEYKSQLSKNLQDYFKS